MPTRLLAPLLILAVLAVSACATTTSRTSASDDLLLQCRAKADDVIKSRYTDPWEREVKRCLDAAQAGNR